MRSLPRLAIAAMLAGILVACTAGNTAETTTEPTGVCASSTSTGDTAVDECLTASCCSQFNVCQASDACLSCITGTGKNCDTNASAKAFWKCASDKRCMGGAGGAGGAGGSGGKGGAGGTGGTACAKDQWGCSPSNPCCAGLVCVPGEQAGVTSPVCVKTCSTASDCPNSNWYCISGQCSVLGCTAGQNYCEGNSLLTCQNNKVVTQSCDSICASGPDKYVLSCGYDAAKGETACICSAEPPCPSGATKCVTKTGTFKNYLATCENGVFVTGEACWNVCYTAGLPVADKCGVKNGKYACLCQGAEPTCKSNADCPPDCWGNGPVCCSICGTAGYCEVSCY